MQADLKGEQLVRDSFTAALAAGQPGLITSSAYNRLPQTPTAIIALGKAAGAMAAAVRDAGYRGVGLVITTDENHRQIAGFECFASAHPVPDERGLAAATAVEKMALWLGAKDHLLLLISGGGSALLPAPAIGISLRQKIALNDALLASGLDIHAMNVVRRLFSRLKGGQLARLAAPAAITQFLLSDVPGDLPQSIASGPAVADPVPFEEAVALIHKHHLDRLDFVAPHLDAIKAGKIAGPVRPGDPVLANVKTHILASNAQCRDAAAAYIRQALPHIECLPAPALDGEASQMAVKLAGQIIDHYQRGGAQPYVLVAGGETTVTLDPAKPGKGGRSQELAVAFAAAMQAAGTKAPRTWVILAGGTDGRDGPTDAAGGVIASSQGFDPNAAAAALASHTSYEYLKAHDQLLMVGATGTNLADLVVIYAQP
jgi:glycerate 2-kinase